ncbi:MAG: DUF2652 domain-containing protein [Ignavibacteria bacterium]
MNQEIQKGYFVLADISGYTGFLANNELDHSHKITSEILELLISSLTPALELAEVEGDALFLYAPYLRITRGETLIELIESTYIKFRNHTLGLKICDCNGCESAMDLDLKFICHFGEYVLQKISGKKKPLGSDVNLSHRLLKNNVSILTGWRAYALFTEECLTEMKMPPDGMTRCIESYEHFNKVTTFNLNLDSRYSELIGKHLAKREEKEADEVFTMEIQAPPAIVWEWLNDFNKRNLWSTNSIWNKNLLHNGRTSVGSTNQCTRGSEKFLEEILEWRPFEQFSAKYHLKPFSVIITNHLHPINRGTKLTCKISFNSGLPRKIFKPLYKLISRRKIKIEKQMLQMRALINHI